MIGHIRGAREAIGTFTFDAITPDVLPTYPALWAADAESQTRMLVAPTHDGEPATDDEGELRQMLFQRSDLFISRNLRLTSQGFGGGPNIAVDVGE